MDIGDFFLEEVSFEVSVEWDLASEKPSSFVEIPFFRGINELRRAWASYFFFSRW